MSERRLLFFDGSAGASGDMLLGALVDLGVPLARLRETWKRLPLDGWTVRSRRIERCALAGRKIDVRVRGPQPGRGWREIERVLDGGKLDPAVRRRASGVFRRLIEAEAEVHGGTPESVHLHEAGGVDAILDVVGTCAAIEWLQVQRIVVSTLTTGFGEIECSHGRYPVPGPATLALLRGIPVEAGSIGVERLTPTGAALLTTLADEWGPLPRMRPSRIGYGAGERDLGSTPNFLRAVLGHADAGPTSTAREAEVGVIECTLDDCTPQALAHATSVLLEAGALDVFTAPVAMKKGRLGHHLTVLTPVGRLDALAQRVFGETTTLGLRTRIDRRLELERREQPVDTRFGSVRVKIGSAGGMQLQVWPEFEDCAARAREHGVALQRVQQAALQAFAAAATARRSGKHGPKKTRNSR